MLHAGKKLYDVFTKAPGNDNDKISLSADTENELFHSMSLKWYGWMLSAMAARSNGGKKQMFVVSRLVKFLGLSRAGQNIMSNFGFASTLRYSDKKAEENLAQARLDNMYTHVSRMKNECTVFSFVLIVRV
jgi:hypothetical protein